MIEYRIQQKRGNGFWEFITDSHGKYYTYNSLNSVKRYALNHVYTIWNTETGRYEMDTEHYRIVVADIDWQPVENV